jgi:hypothetical protein
VHFLHPGHEFGVRGGAARVDLAVGVPEGAGSQERQQPRVLTTQVDQLELFALRLFGQVLGRGDDLELGHPQSDDLLAEFVCDIVAFAQAIGRRVEDAHSHPQGGLVRIHVVAVGEAEQGVPRLDQGGLAEAVRPKPERLATLAIEERAAGLAAEGQAVGAAIGGGDFFGHLRAS